MYTKYRLVPIFNFHLSILDNPNHCSFVRTALGFQILIILIIAHLYALPWGLNSLLVGKDSAHFHPLCHATNRSLVPILILKVCALLIKLQDENKHETHDNEAIE